MTSSLQNDRPKERIPLDAHLAPTHNHCVFSLSFQNFFLMLTIFFTLFQRYMKDFVKIMLYNEFYSQVNIKPDFLVYTR